MRKNNRFLTFALIFAFICPSDVLAVPSLAAVPSSSGSSSLSQIGVVAAVKGSVQVVTPGNVGRVVESGEPIYLGDEIKTDSEGSLQVMLMDQTIFTIGPNSAMVIDEFVYDPSTANGKVKAKVLKGTFRFITGKIAHKKPSNMEVDLPSGTIGIRGTMVMGEVVGFKSTVALTGPGPKNNAGYDGGGFVLSNDVKGTKKSTNVMMAPFGSQIPGKGMAPTRAFRVDDALLSRWSKTLAAKPQNNNQPAASKRTPTQQGKAKKAPVTFKKKIAKTPSATKQAGQAKAGARVQLKSLKALQRVGKVLGQETDKAAIDAADTIENQVPDGLTTREQIIAEQRRLLSGASQGSGLFHFEQKNVKMTGPGVGGSNVSEYNISLDLDLGNRSIGGGNSRVDGMLNGQNFNFPINTEFDPGEGEFAVIDFNDIPNEASGAGSCSSCHSATVLVALFNRDGQVARNLDHSVEIFDNSANLLAKGSGEAGPRVGGPSD